MSSCGAVSPRPPSSPALPEEAEMETTITINGVARTFDVEPRVLLVDLLRTQRRAHRHPHRLRHDELRRVHGPARRQAGEVLHGLRRPGGRARGHHGRGARQGRRAPPDPGRLQGGARPAVRLLHAGDDARRHGAASSATPTRATTEIRWAISGNLCRCTGYMNIVKAIQRAASRAAPRGQGSAAG